MKRSDFRFTERLRVRWAEVDLQGIVFNGHYLMYLDTAIAGYWRAMAMPYQQTMAALEGDLYVRKAMLEYVGSARFDECIDIALRCQRIGNSSISFAAAVFRADALLVLGELVYVFADPASQTAKPVPGALRDWLDDFEAGRPMIEVRVGAWAALSEAAQAIRTTVFVQEQQIPADLEWDAADAVALHALACNRLGAPLATGRLLEHVPGVGKIGRMAVLPAWRGSGVGRQVLDALMQAARERGDREVLLHAQCSAESFYQRAGFTSRGPRFEEAGIPHVEMTRSVLR